MLSAAIATVLVFGQSATGAKPVPLLMPVPVTVTRTPPPPPAPAATYRPNPVPRSNHGSWITSDDYPSRAMREEREGRTMAELAVGERGRALTCGIAQSAGSIDLDRATCRNLLRRGRFHPATTASGEPIIARLRIPVDWRLPRDDGQPPVAVVPEITPTPPAQLAIPLVDVGDLGTLAEYNPPPSPSQPGVPPQLTQSWFLTIDIDRDGRVVGCAPSSPSADPAFDAMICTRYRERGRFAPALQADGRAVMSSLYALWTLNMTPPPSTP